MIWASDIFLFFQKWLDRFGLFVCWIAINPSMGICFGQPLLRGCRVLLLQMCVGF